MFSGLLELPWWGYVAVTLGLTHVTIAAVTIFLHRHQAHRALELGPVPSHFFRMWLWLTTGMVTKEWAAIHRKHHAKCETAEDPHSPQVYGLQRVLWTGVFLYVKEAYNPDTIERYGHGTPDDWMERNLYSRFPALGVVLCFLADVVLFGALPGAVIWAVQMVWIPFWAAGVINGVGHSLGYRNFSSADASTNIFPIGILIGGEELHNNHHTYATSARLSNKWYEFDIGWMYIRILETFGMAKVKKVAPTARFAEPRSLIDVAALQVIITHRYDVMARYMRSMRSVAREELAKLRVDYADRRAMRRLLVRGATAEQGMAVAQQQRLSTLMSQSEPLKKFQAMRDELEALWSRSAATHEQLVKQLQDWIARAESSGVQQLVDFSATLRRYAH